MRKFLTVLLLIAAAVFASEAAADTAASARAGWLLNRADASTPTIHRASLPQAGVGGVSSQASYGEGGHSGVVKPLLLSLLMPGLGEASLGYKRGYPMMALDIASWIGVKHYHDLGKQKRQEYYDYLDAHWSESKLAAAFGTPDDPGTFFYSVDDYQQLSLWVSREDDPREYYENAGKWDQFVFGWDDFSDPRGWPEYSDGSWVDLTSQILKDTRVSSHREVYRAMRTDSNDQFDHRDKLIYLNMLTRVISMFQVAYLQGVFTSGSRNGMRLAGHPVALIAEPRGFSASRLGVAISY